MPESVHHITVMTDRPEEVVNFAREGLGLAESAVLETPRELISDLLGWPTGGGAVRSTLLGSGRAGLLEVVALPTDLQASPEASNVQYQVSFRVPDVVAVLQHPSFAALADRSCRGPFELDHGGVRTLIVAVTIGGVTFLLSQSLRD